uniref:Metalloendopeptidase n=1 Tax=Schistocephalus solidus TaxID=70667 RepID=A0A183SAV7_SCHSO
LNTLELYPANLESPTCVLIYDIANNSLPFLLSYEQVCVSFHSPKLECSISFYRCCLFVPVRLKMCSKLQLLNLTYGLVMHELGHVIGLDHEHIRADRDNFVDVSLEGVPRDYWGFYARKNQAELRIYGTPYDLQSVMHYGPGVSKNFVKQIRTSAVNGISIKLPYLQEN